MASATLKSMETEVAHALEHINIPSYFIDQAGVIRWVNTAARRLVGDVEGRQFTSVVAPEDTRRARELFARRLLGNLDSTDTPVVLVDDNGDRVSVEVSSVPLTRGDHVVGVFGQVSDVLEEPVLHPELAPHTAPIRDPSSARARSHDEPDRRGASSQPRDRPQPHPAPAPGTGRPLAPRSGRPRARRSRPGDSLTPRPARSPPAALRAPRGDRAPRALERRSRRTRS